jgi:hypothetical protein
MVYQFYNWMVCFFLLIDWKKFSINVWGGIAACILQLIHDTEQEIIGNYHVHHAGIWILKSSAFFTFGIVFTMGVVFLQFMPQNKILKIIHVVAFSVGFLAFEFIALANGLLENVHSHYLLSLADNILVMVTIAWTKDFVLYIYKSIGRNPQRC